MPSEVAKEIVDKIYGDDKASALDAVKDAISAKSYELIQQRKLDFAKSMGFDLDDTAQDAADEIENSLPDSTESPEDVEVDERQPHEPPTDEVETTDQPEEETTDETDQ